MTSASNLRLVASASARRQGFARKPRRLTPALTATGATAQQVVKQLLDATASLIYHRLKHEVPDSDTPPKKIAQVVLANVDGEPVFQTFCSLGSREPAPTVRRRRAEIHQGRA